jgi:hypothetical protein
LGEIDFSSQKAILEKVDPNARKQFDEFLKRYPRENQALPGSVVRELQSLLAGKISVGDVSFFHQSEFNNKQESAKESRRFKNHREIQYSLGALKGIEKIESLRKAFPVDILPQLDELLSLAFGVGELAEKLASTFSFGLAKTVEEAIKARRVGTGKEVVRKTSLMNWVMNTVEKVNREKKIAKEISRAALAVRVLGKWPVGKKALKKAGLKDFDKKPVKKTIENHLKKLGYYRDLARVSRI